MAPHAEKDSITNEEKLVANGEKTVVSGEKVASNGEKTVVNGQKTPRTGKGKGKGKGEAAKKERVQRLDQLYSKKNRKIHFVPTPKSFEAHEKPGQASHVVLKVRRIICDKGFPTSIEIDIKSTLLRDVLSDIFEGIEGLKLNESPPVASPELLFYASNGLKERVKREEAKEKPNKALIDEVNVALQFVAEDYGSTMDSLASLAEHNEITFDLLWTLFPPDTTVYTKSNLLHEHQLLKLKMGEYGSCDNGSKFFSMDLKFISHDGAKIGWAETKLQINQFEGAKKVHNLLCFPLAQHPERDEIEAQLSQRGRRYLELQQPTYQEYAGAAIVEDQSVIVNDGYKKVTIHVSGRIMLDPLIFLQQNEYTELLKPDIEIEINPASLAPAEVIFCNHNVAGFSFRQKKWCLFAIPRMWDVTWNTNAFSKLVMEPRKRDLVHSLVKSHRNGAETFDDVVSGKGKGLVGLLSGNPGVGKTLTAEVIAEVTKRPLYMLSAGELGTYVSDVEKNLDMVLEVTRTWGCVLLIDEADVFLQERDGKDLERNALVSIFLRRLEYFQGVLIMTTNRKATIDPAFDSRIHFKLHYADLSVASRAAIWRNCLDNIPSTVSKSAIGEEEVKELATLNLNGRQIKNSMACAVSIALAEETKLTLDSIKVILDMVVDSDGQ